jgi:hypothetical protein
MRLQCVVQRAVGAVRIRHKVEHCCCYDCSRSDGTSPEIKFGRHMQRITESIWSMFEELRILHGDFARESSALSLHEVSLGGGRGRTA